MVKPDFHLVAMVTIKVTDVMSIYFCNKKIVIFTPYIEDKIDLYWSVAMTRLNRNQTSILNNEQTQITK